MEATAKHSLESITHLKRWTDKLFSFRLTRQPGFRFIPGQFVRLGLEREDGQLVWRPYSMVSAAYDDYLEFYSIVVPGGEFTSRLAQRKVGDTVLVDRTCYGFLTAERLESGGDLWFLATGTGLAPFISILHDPRVWESHDHLILAHSTRIAAELNYQDTLAALEKHPLFGSQAHKLRYLPVVTREAVPGALSERLTTLIDNGRLEQAAGLALDPARSRVMVCGNPDMSEDCRQRLAARGFSPPRRGQPGTMVFEHSF
ncbi:MAG TPA: ferredoxin--NADP reductase [Azospira sp.]|nr:ferredoxin--NADP reductase [Azospira sp.]